MPGNDFKPKSSNKQKNLSLYLPLVRLQIKFPVQLSHRDTFGIQDVSLDGLEGISARLGLALKGGHGVLQSLVTLKQEKVIGNARKSG